jgi:Leucine-rich repeat (LRR) protein
MLKSQIFISLLLFVLMSPLAQAATDCAAVTEIPSTECEILIDFYNSTDGVNWIRNGGWNVTNTPCSWYGVSCSGGHVSKLYLDSNKLTGSIPSELGNLSMLREIWLGSNQLTGTIPRKLGTLSNLWMLDLDGNQLTGSIPRELGNLSNLGWFFLSDNQLTGPIPSELGKLTWLGDLRLDNNELCGEIPVELKNLSNIYKLKLDNNHLTASDSSLIAWLDSRSPGWDTTQTSCSGFFTTPIVRIAENAGTVTLTVQRNGDTSGTLEIDYATTDVSAEQGHDYIEATGTLSWAGGDATDKSFTITIIDDGNSETNETFIVTLSMPISGESLDNATIVIKDNEPADCAVVTEIPSVECEALVALYNSTGGVNWRNNDGWNETNTPCSWNGVSCSEGHVSKLYLAGNQLTGSIPTELGKLTNLRELNLSDNQLTGSIPTELGKLTNLRELRLSRNQLTGSIPTELGNLSNLEFLSLYENDLAGSIPSELGNLSNLEFLSLHGNDLAGSIPKELGNLTNLSGFYLYNNQLGES